MANFFIDRPIFAWVLAILLCLTGTLAIFSLPVEQYPDLAPPNVRVTANYPGASAQTLDDAPRDKCAHFREINGIAAAFQHLQKNYNPIASSFL